MQNKGVPGGIISSSQMGTIILPSAFSIIETGDNMITTIPLSPGVTLRCWQDGRFKQGCVSIQLVRPMKAGEAAMNALLPSVLLRGSRNHPDLRSITMALDDLYGAAISPLVRRVGDYQTTGLFCAFMDQRFALPGDRVLEPMADFLRELLLEPVLEEGVFDPEYVESEKKNLISAIEAEMNDKQTYAMNQLLKAMCREDSFGLPRLGEPEEIEAITPEGLYQHYLKILRESPVNLFYVGSAAPEAVAELLRPLFEGLNRAPIMLPAQTDFHAGEGCHVCETLDVTQGKLCLGYTTPMTNRHPGFAAMQVLNSLFGAGMTSKLFLKVREEQSLCYSIGSAYYSAKGILTVYAGIDQEQEETTRRAIAHQLELCQQGQITAEELEAAQKALLSSLQSTHDSPGAIESYYSTAALSGLGMTPVEYAQAVQAVTVEAAAEAARSLTLHSSYFLKGADSI